MVAEGKGGSAGRPRDIRADGRILTAAADLLRLRGVRGLRIDDVAEAAGVAKTTIYRRWPTLTHLAVAAVEHSLGERPLPHSDDAAADLRAYAALLLDGLRASRANVWHVGMEVAASGDDELRRLYRTRIIDPARDGLVALLARAQREGGVGPGDPRAIVDAAIGALVYRVGVLGEEPTTAVLDDVVALFLGKP